MKNCAFAILCVCIILVFPSGVCAQTSGDQTITFFVEDINEISVSGNPGALNIITAAAGFQPDVVSESTTTYSITTNETNKKITGVLDGEMPAGISLKVNLTAPSGSTSLGDVTLSSVPADLVSGITAMIASSLTITYKLSATVQAGVVNLGSKIVTLTISN